jgi:tRNA-specific 2-thiouridylase
MSGGVDSSVAAAILKHQGHDVVGFTMQLWNQRRRLAPDEEPQPSRCCSLDDVYDARCVANDLGIPFYVLNLEQEFERSVVRPLLKIILPDPDTVCVLQPKLKFARLVNMARGWRGSGSDNHYARVEYNERTGRFMLKKGRDLSKDQSYFLFEMTQKQLERAVFPLGDMTKLEVRETARRVGLDTASKPESQEICFVPDGDYARFVENYARYEMGEPGASAGEIRTADGKLIGAHAGLHRFTIGQRRGIGIASSEPLYVVKIDVPLNQLVVGNRNELYGESLTAIGVNWLAIAPPEEPVRANVRIRYRAIEAPATITATGAGRVRVVFDEPQAAITPGQAAVFYDAR